MKNGLTAIISAVVGWASLEVLFATKAVPYGALGVGLGQFFMMIFPSFYLSPYQVLFGNVLFDPIVLLAASMIALVIGIVNQRRA